MAGQGSSFKANDVFRTGRDAIDGNTLGNCYIQSSEDEQKLLNSVGRATKKPLLLNKKEQFQLITHYKIKKRCPGIALIFNHYTYDGNQQNPRKCAKEDGLKLENLLNYLNFKYYIFNDYTVDEIKGEVKNCKSKYNFKKYSSLLIVIMTHGEKYDYVWAKDRSYNLRNVFYSEFTSEKYPHLMGKPRIFFIQSCQGLGVDDGVTLCTTQCDGYFPQTTPINYHRDFLLVYSTIDGYLSFNNSAGSWFIQAICKELAENCYNRHLISCLKSVTRVIGIDKESSTDEKTQHMKKQNVCVINMLDKFIQFEQ